MEDFRLDDIQDGAFNDRKQSICFGWDWNATFARASWRSLNGLKMTSSCDLWGVRRSVGPSSCKTEVAGRSGRGMLLNSQLGTCKLSRLTMNALANTCWPLEHWVATKDQSWTAVVTLMAVGRILTSINQRQPKLIELAKWITFWQNNLKVVLMDDL